MPPARHATIFIVSDHGFKTYDKVIHPNALLTSKGLQEDVWVIPEGGSAMVYITRPAKKAELAPRLRAEFAAVTRREPGRRTRANSRNWVPSPERADGGPGPVRRRSVRVRWRNQRGGRHGRPGGVDSGRARVHQHRHLR